MQRTMPERAVTKLRRRAPLHLDPRRSIAIKRDVHRFEVDTDPDTLARAFAEVMTDPKGTFGLIRVKRPAARMGRPFEPGERFQGCFSLERAALDWLARSRLRGATRAVERLLARPLVQRLVIWIEDAALSDYGEIVAIEMEPDTARGEIHRLHYRYLDGTPIAGSSTFLIEPLGDHGAALTQIFEYQEIGGLALGTFQRMGLKMHDQVVHMQVARAAERAGARLLSGTIPAAYAAE